MLDEVGTQSRGAWLAGCLVSGAAALALPLACAGAGFWWWTRVPDRAPPVSYGYVVPADQRVIGGLDLGRVHQELWVAWVVARDADGRAAATRAVVDALAADPGLAALAGELGAQEDAAGLAERVDLWNAAMTARNAPWALGAGLDVGRPYMKTHYLAARPTVRFRTRRGGGDEDSDRETRVQVGLRADHLGIVESWLGLADDVGEAIVVVDRVADFAFDRLWPAMDPADPDPLSVAFREAARAALGDEVADRLTATAPARRAMVAARTAVEDRRDRCGSRFVVRFGWAGLDELGDLYRWADRERAEACPGITRAEAEAIGHGTMAIRADPDLPAALEALVAWSARHVVVHEARHQLDHEDWGAGVPPPCEPCLIDGRARVEASAYLSALAGGDGLVAWVQGCEVVRDGGGGSARVALTTLGRELKLDCESAPPADLSARAAALSRTWFGRDEDIAIHDLPARLPFALARPGDGP